MNSELARIQHEMKTRNANSRCEYKVILAVTLLSEAEAECSRLKPLAEAAEWGLSQSALVDTGDTKRFGCILNIKPGSTIESVTFGHGI